MEPYMECQVLSLRRSPRSNSRLMHVEELEARWCPAAGKGAPMLNYTVVQMNDPGVVITGQVTGTYNSYSTVNFSGAVTRSVTTDINGNFSFTANANYLGTVYAIGADGHGVMTNSLSAQVSSLPPMFTSFTATQG